MRFGGILSGLLTLVLVVMGLAAGAFFYFQIEFTGEGPSDAEATFLVEQGKGLADIASDLQQEGLISDSRVFIAGAFLYDSGGKLKAGEYRIPARASMEEVLDLLVAGKSIQHKLTVPEGLTSEQIVQKVIDHPVLVGDVTEIPAEGTVLPDTYIFLRGMTRQQLIDRMRAAQKAVVEKLWEARAPGLPLKDPEEAIILASIVEKETGKPGERPRVASVFLNRLKRRIRLQSDPTIIYGIVGGKGVLDRPIRKSDIATKTPYNTYQIDGLPPTPIANPGRAAIEAVLQPAESNDLYFVADGTGGHAFAGTLSEHRRNVALWRQIEAERRRLQAAESETTASEPASAETDDDEADEIAAEPAAKLPPPPPPPPPAEPEIGRQQASPTPFPQPRPAPGVTGSVVASSTVNAPDPAKEAEAPKAQLRESVGLPKTSPATVPKPRPRPDYADTNDGDAIIEAEQETKATSPSPPERIRADETRRQHPRTVTTDQGFGR